MANLLITLGAVVVLAARTAAAGPDPTISSGSNRKTVDKIILPDEFFPKIRNLTANLTHYDLKGSGNISESEMSHGRRLGSQYCTSKMSSMSGSYVLLGDSAAGGQTNAWWDPLINTNSWDSVDAYYIYNDLYEPLVTGPLFSDEWCVEMSYTHSVVDIDADIDLNGLKCPDCGAWAGAEAMMGMYCERDATWHASEWVPPECYASCDAWWGGSWTFGYWTVAYWEVGATTCEVEFSIGGGYEYNLDLQISNPDFKNEGWTETAWEGPTIPVYSVGSGLSFDIDATPWVDVGVSGSMTGTGSYEATASGEGQSP